MTDEVTIRLTWPNDWPHVAALPDACALAPEGALAHLDDFVVAGRGGAAAIQAFEQFTGACPAGATFMSLAPC